MKIKNITFLLVVSLLLSSCDSGVEWKDSPYIVVWLDTGSNRTLDYGFTNGNSIGRVNAEVISVGSNDSFVVAKQRHLKSGKVSYFYIERSKDHKYLNANKITQGPYSEKMFKVISLELGLPDFSRDF